MSSWSWDGSILATGSNDKSLVVVRAVEGEGQQEPLVGGVLPALFCTVAQGEEVRLTPHDGTVRDCTFLAESATLVSAGAGDCNIQVVPGWCGL